MVESLGKNEDSCATIFKCLPMGGPIYAARIARRDDERILARSFGAKSRSFDTFFRSITGAAKTDRMFSQKVDVALDVKLIRRFFAEHGLEPARIRGLVYTDLAY